MGLRYENLDRETRRIMVEEIEADIRDGRLYVAENRLSDAGRAAYPNLLRTAAGEHNDDWLAGELRKPGIMNPRQQRKHASGKVTMVKVPWNAAETLAEGEFNRFYIRALCIRALGDRLIRLVVYRAKAVENPRPDSEARIGTALAPEQLLADLRKNVGWEAALGLAQPNSGLTVRLEALPLGG